MRQKGQAWIRRHPLEAFALIGLLACFGLLFPAILFIPQSETWGQLLSFYLARIAVYTPVLTGMWVARALRPGRRAVSRVRLLLIFVPLWLAAASVQTAMLSLEVTSDLSLAVLFLISLPAGLLPALVITLAVYGSAGVRQMLASLIRPRGNILYYLIALLTFPIVHVAGHGITHMLNGDPWRPPLGQLSALSAPIAITFFSVLLFSGGINEESGWRGFAQQRLQARYSPLMANLILWLLMVIWHIPNDIVQYRHGNYLLMRFGLYPFIALLFGWIYNRTKGSIWTVAIFHASMNAMNPIAGIFPITPAGSILLIGFTIIVAAADRMWRKLPADHPAVHEADAPPVIAQFAV